ncbi:hypothetical protein [Halorubrum sp. DTA46]|uniref:hypothetical protein n=1 Tax=Halorubrum sp. DTA46 TaxID=3402162 RepID=UPI003AABD99F
MSKTQLIQEVSTEAEIRDQMERVFDTHEKSAQALGDPTLSNHNDGEDMYKRLSMAPFHKYLALCEKRDQNVATYPSAWATPLIHLKEREIQLLEQLVGEVEYDPNDPHPSHEALERYPLPRAKALEWIADDEGDRTGFGSSGARTVDAWTAGGSDYFAYGPPGRGKSTLMQATVSWLMQLNNETVLLADTMDDSGTNERLEWLPLAPWATIAVPAGIPIDVRIVPESPQVAPFHVDLADICRDVVRYESPRDLLNQLLEGQFYVVYPDPLHRGCEEASRHAFHGPNRVTPVGEPGPSSSTPADQWWFAFIQARIKFSEFNHWTSILVDEAGNLFDPDAEKDVHEEYQKIKKFAKDFADARKNGVSVFSYAHALGELIRFFRAKQRWWVTMSRASPPIGKSLPGNKSCPIPTERYTNGMEKGEAMAWNSKNYASISWPNVKGKARLDAEVSIDFDLEAVGL